MDLSKYPVTTPFGYVPGYPLNNGFHNGIDYGLPMDTPVIINGVEIGLSNNTGASTGPHLHIGKYQNGAAQDPGVNQGTRFNSAVVFDVGKDATNGNYVRLTADGALWNYLHLADGSIKVKAGQVLSGGQQGGDMPLTDSSLDKLIKMAKGDEPTAAELGDTNWRDDPNLAITTLWQFYGQERYKQPVLVPGDVDNLFKDLGITPTQADYDAAANLSYKDFVYYFETQVKNREPKPADNGTGSYTVADRQQATETNNLVKQIWQKITSIFK